MNDYLSEVYDWITKQDNTFSGDVNIESFQQKMQDDSYAKEMYNWMASIDKTLPNDLSESDFLAKVKKKDSSALQSAVSPEDTQDIASVSEGGQPSLAQLSQDSLEERFSGFKDLPEEEQDSFRKQEEKRPFYEAHGLDMDQIEASKKREEEVENKLASGDFKPGRNVNPWAKTENIFQKSLEPTEKIDLESELQSIKTSRWEREEKVFTADSQYHNAKYEQIIENYPPEERGEQYEKENVDLGYIPTDYIDLDGERLSVKALEKKLYDQDFIDDLQDGKVNLTIDNANDIEVLDYLNELAQRQIESGGQFGDFMEGIYTGALDQFVAGPLEVAEGLAAVGMDALETIPRMAMQAVGIGDGPSQYHTSLYMNRGGLAAGAVKKHVDKVREKKRLYYEDTITESLIKGHYGNAFAQTSNSLAESAPLIVGMIASSPALVRKFGEKAAKKITIGAVGLTTFGTQSIDLKQRRLKGELDISDGMLLLNAALTGGAEAFFERATLGIINAGRGVLKLGKVTAPELADKFVKGFGKSLWQEGTSEGLTELSNSLTNIFTGTEEYTGIEDIAVRLSDAALIGAIMGGGMHSIPYAAKSISEAKFKMLDSHISVLFTLEDGSTKEMSRADALRFVKDPLVAAQVRDGSIGMDASLNPLGEKVLEDIVYGFHAPDAVASREIMFDKEKVVQDLANKLEASKEVTPEDVNALADAMAEMEAEGKVNEYNVTDRTVATRKRITKLLKSKGVEIVDAVQQQDTSMSKVTETTDADKIDSKEQYRSIKKQIKDGKKKPTFVKSQNQPGVKIEGESVQTSEVTQGRFKSVSEAKNAIKEFELKQKAAKDGKVVSNEAFPINNKEFIDTRKETLDEIPKEVLDKNEYHIISPSKKGLNAQEKASRMDKLKSALDDAGAEYYTVKGVYNGVAEESLVVTGINNAQALSLGRNLGQESVFSSKDGLMFGNGSVAPLTGDVVKGPEARKRDSLTIMNVGGRKVSIHAGVDRANMSYGKNFNSDNIHRLDESDPNYDSELFEGVPEDRKRALGFTFKLLSSIGGLNVNIVRNSEAMAGQMKQLGQNSDSIAKNKRASFFRAADKTIYVNLETVQGNTLFHEIIHPMVDFIKETDPALYSKIEGEVAESNVKRRVTKDGRRLKGSYMEWAFSNYTTESEKAAYFNEKTQKFDIDRFKKENPERFESFVEEAFAEMMGDAAYGHFVNRQSTLGRLRELMKEILKKITPLKFDNPESVSLDDLSLTDIRKNLAGALVDGRTITVGGVEFEDGESQSDLRNQAIDLLEDTEDLSEYGVESESRSTLRELGIALDARQRDKYKVIDKDTKTEDASDYISDFIKDEVIYSIENVEDSGAGWYEEKYERALNNLAEVNDFMKEGEPSRELFTMFLAITSDGQTVSQNLDYAERLTKEYVENKTINVDAIDFGGTGKASIKINTRNILDLLDQFNGDIVQVKDFLNIQNSISEFKKDYPDMVKKSNYEMTGEAADKIKLPMAAMIFGPKLGAFHGNLTGGSGYLTMDRWFNRTFNRYRGIVKKPLGKERYDKAREAIIKLKSLESKYNLDYGIKLPSSKNLSKDRVVEIAKKVASLYVKDNKRRKSLPKELKSLESPLNTFSKDYSDLQDAPFGKKDRTFMYDSIWKAQEKLSKKGYDVTVADIQAILWYFEKSLYKKFGVAGPPIESYEEVSERVISDLRLQAPALFNEPNPEAGDVARIYMIENSEEFGIDSNAEVAAVSQLDDENSKMIADAYEALVDNPKDPEVKESYEALADETLRQYDAIVNRGYEVEIWRGEGEPYANSAEMIQDARDNKHMYIFGTEAGFGEGSITPEQREDNAMLAETEYADVNGEPLLVNDIFRFVHDFFGHTELGNGFGPIGEENAWLTHSRMYSPTARKAMTTETRGQNSWVNYNKNLRREDGSVPKRGDEDYVPLSERPFANQKMGILPNEIIHPTDLKYQVPTDGETNVYTSGLATIAWDISKAIIDADYKAGKYVTKVLAKTGTDKSQRKLEREGYDAIGYDIRLSTLLFKPFGTHSNAEVKEIMVRSKGDLNLEIFRASEASKALKRAIKKSDLTSKDVDHLLHNFEEVKTMEDGEIKSALIQMRMHIDRLSRTLINEGLVNGQTQFTIDANMGVYVSRAYKQYNSKNWKQTDNDIIQKAWEFLYNEAKKDNPEASEAKLKEIADLAIDNLTSEKDFVRFSSGASSLDGLSRVNTIFKEKKVIPEEIRELWGEIDNPTYNYSQTIKKMAQTISAERMYKEVLQLGEGKFISDTQTTDFFNKIEGEKFGTLNGKYVDNEMYAVMSQVNRQLSDGSANKIYNTYMKLVLFNKKMKTVYNIGTHAKNVIGNSTFATMNGHLTMDLKMWENIKLSLRGIKDMKDSEAKALYEKLVSYGVVNSSASLQELRGIAEDINQNNFDFDTWITKGKIPKAIKEAGKWVDEGLTTLYQKEDDVWKIFGFLAEKARYTKAGLDVKTAEEMAAKNIRNTYPNYDQIPRVIRMLGRSPLVGSFVAFQAEAVRNAKNTIKLGFEELGSDNPEIRKIGATRVAGTIATMTVLEGLQIYTAQTIGQALGFLGEDEEDSEAKKIRLLLPMWDAVGSLVVWNRGKLDSLQYSEQQGGDTYFDYINFSSISGVGYIRDILRLAFNDVDTKVGEESMTRILEKIYEPFLSEEMTKVIIKDALGNKGEKIYKETDSWSTKAWNIVSYVGEKVQPGTLKSGSRIKESIFDGDSELVSGYEMLALFGIRISRVNVNKNLSIKGYFINKEMVSRVGRSPLRKKDSLLEAYKSDAALDENLNMMADLMAAASLNGLSGKDIQNILRYKDKGVKSGISEAVVQEAYRRFENRYIDDVLNVRRERKEFKRVDDINNLTNTL